MWPWHRDRYKAGVSIPSDAGALLDGDAVARLLAGAMSRGEGACLLRYGDTGGRILARPETGTPAWAYLQAFLGRDITPDQVDWLARRIEESAMKADIVGLRSDLLGPLMPESFPRLPDDQIVAELVRLYPIRRYERGVLSPDDARHSRWRQEGAVWVMGLSGEFRSTWCRTSAASWPHSGWIADGFPSV